MEHGFREAFDEDNSQRATTLEFEEGLERLAGVGRKDAASASLRRCSTLACGMPSECLVHFSSCQIEILL